MLVAAAVCPSPPLLVPEIAQGAAPETDEVRAACGDALGVLAAARPDRLVVVGTGPGTGTVPCPGGTRGSFRGVGFPLDVTLGTGDGRGRLPQSLCVGAWLLEHAGGPAAPTEGLAVGERTDAETCAAAGRRLTADEDRLALLVMGDGTHCRAQKAPGYFDGRAQGFDAAAARALGSADTGALLALDAGLAGELQAAGRAAWQVLAGAARGAGLEGRLLYDEAPYGVGYFVASWS